MSFVISHTEENKSLLKLISQLYFVSLYTDHEFMLCSKMAYLKLDIKALTIYILSGINNSTLTSNQATT
jgi:hypothetical protein